MVISSIVRSWLFLIPLIPSVITAVFVLYHLLIDRALRNALNNHVVILLLVSGLIESLTDTVWYIRFYRTGTALSSTPVFCFAWVYLSAVAYISTYILMAWASIERHILIFYPNWFGTRIKRSFFHYLPLAVCILYPTIFYFVTLIVIPCDVPFDYSKRLCGRYSCITGVSWIALWDSIAHYIIPPFITVIFSVTLLVRVLYRRYRVRRRVEWGNYKKLSAQLLPISVLCIILQFPPMVLYAAYSAGVSRSVASDYYYDGILFTYWVVLFTPFASAVSLPDLQTKCRNVILFWRTRHAVVVPEIQMMNHPIVGQTPVAVLNVC